MLAGKPVIVDIVENIDIMDENGRLVGKQRLRLLQPSTRLQESVGLIAEAHQRSIVLTADVVDNLLGKVMDIDDEVVVALRHQLADVPLQQRLATNGHQRLGHGVGEWFQSGAETGSENHGLLHRGEWLVVRGERTWLIPCSRWQMRTSMPNFSWICSARCWAE